MGMDFPNDIATNVFRIDNVKEIYWAFYSRKYDKQREELDAVLGEEETDLASHILHTEWILRARGNHVLGDEYGIWIFSFSEAEKQGADQVLTSSRFECSFSGSEHAADIATASKPGLPVPRPNNAATSAPAFLGDRGKLNAQAYGANTEAILQLETKDASQNVSNAGARDLRTRIASAISQSLCHTLAKESSFLQVGSNNLIDIHSLANTAFEDLEASKATKTTLSLSFGIDWLPPGSLLITYTYSNIARLSRVSQFLLDDQISTKLPTGTAVLMSPSGTIGQYLGVDTTSRRDPLHSSRAELKSSISAHLARIGMFVPSDSQWLRVLLERQSSEGEPNESSNSTTGTPITLWPSRFCLCRDVAAFSEYQNVTKLIDNTTDNIFDPLAKAESWFLSRAKRSKALEVKWQREELEAQRVEEPEETDEEDDLSDFDIQVTRGITPQDASGIYPTPPDGIPSSLPDSSPNNISNHVEPEMEQNAQPIPEAITRPYAEHESGDLFDEIEMDIFTANGLTEADFSFFDEPSPIYEEVQHNNDEMITDDDLGHQVAAETAAVLLPSDNPNPRNTPAEIGNPNATTHLALDNEESAEVPSFTGHLGDTTESQAELHINAVGDDENPIKFGTQTPGENGVHLASRYEEPQQLQRTSFDTVPFRAKSYGFDDNYVLKGRYGFDLDDPAKPIEPRGLSRDENDVLPQSGIAQASDSPSEGDTTIETNDTDEESSHRSPVLLTDDLEMGEIEELSKASSLKRKRTASEDLHHAARPDSPSPTDLECPEQILKDPVPPMLELFSPRDVRHAMLLSTVDFCLQTSHEPLFVGNDKTFVQVAQTLADQVASGLRLSHWMHDPALAQSSAKLIGSDQHIEAIMTNLASNAGKTGRRCNLKEFATHGERNAVPGSLEQTNIQQSQKMQKPAYPTRPSTTAVQSTFKLQSAYARVQRTGTSIDISAPALRFWEELSLAPSHESKNVTALCIYPVNLDVLDHVMTFLNMIKGAYQSCNLGFFGQGTRLENDSKILPPVPTSGREDLLPQVSTVCARFGKRLGEQKLRDGNTVIYMVNFYGPQHLPTLCAGFLKLFDAYKVAVRQQQVETPNDLVLQIIPSDVICSSEVITMPSPSDYRSLAFEVYDHCGPDRSNEHKQNPQYLSTPAIRLAKTIPKAIDLRLTPDSSGPMLQTDNCLHVAYAWNISDHWLTASWTDNLGVLSWNACYYFGGQEEPPRQYFSDVAKEIWETTCDMMRLHSTPWRLFICKDSAVHREELDTWQALLMNHTKPSIISTFLSIDTDPLLRFPLPRRHNSISELASNTFATPWTTLQPNDPPPDVGSTPTAASQVSTPPPNNAFVDSHDAEARLIDITDETWGIIMSNTLYPSPPSSFPSGAVCKPLATAYLMKRAGPRDEDGLVRLALGFLSVQMGHKMVIKEVLGMYAGLGLLARVRGVVDEVKGLMPLHVAAARKAHAVVNATMRYADG